MTQLGSLNFCVLCAEATHEIHIIMVSRQRESGHEKYSQGTNLDVRSFNTEQDHGCTLRSKEQ